MMQRLNRKTHPRVLDYEQEIWAQDVETFALEEKRDFPPPLQGTPLLCGLEEPTKDSGWGYALEPGEAKKAW
jgi:hypothetical protein